MADKLGFPPYQGLPFDYRAPAIDGFAEWEIGVPDPLIESGWVGGTRLTYAGASGIPMVSFQALKDKGSNDFIYLSFVVRFDWEFNDNDAVILVLQPSFNAAAHGAGTRRVLIRPNINPLGAGAGDNPQNPLPDYSVTVPTQGGGTLTIPIRTNRKSVPTFSKFVAGSGGSTDSWVDIAPIAGFDIKARSWSLSDTDLCWSLEIKLPATNAPGVGDWIDLNPASFGIYFNVLRFSTPPSILTFATVTQFSWPRGHVVSDADPEGPYASLNDIMIPASRMGEATLGAGAGVFFDGGWSSIGVLSGSTVTGTIDATLNTVNRLVARLKNDATTAAQGVGGTFRLADFGIGPNPSVNGSWGKIDPAASGSPAPNNKNPTDRLTVPANNGTAQLQMDWKIDQGVRNKYFGHGYDQCLLVELDSDQNAAFRESSYRRNIAFANLSEVEREVVVSGKDHGPPPAGETDHEFLLTTSHRFLSSTLDCDGWAPSGQQTRYETRRESGMGMPASSGEGKDPQWGKTAPPLAEAVFESWGAAKGPVHNWISVTSAFRRTGQTLTLGGVGYSLFEAVDNFSHVLSHEGPVDRWAFSLTGADLTPITDAVNRVRVPVDGEAVLKVRYEAVTRGSSPTTWPWWVWVLLVLLLLVVIWVLS